MNEPLRLMAVLAHPDDESMGTGGILAKYAAEGIETYLLTATRGQRGYQGIPAPDPGLEGLGQVREAELRAAAKVLGLHEVTLLDYVDGDLDRADPSEIIGLIAGHLRRVRPQVVVTFGMDGGYGHPDHIAISQFATAATVLAAAPAATDGSAPPHQVSKLYYLLNSKALVKAFNSVFPPLAMEVDGVTRRWDGWDDWAITTEIDADAYWETACAAIRCHQSQVVTLPNFALKLVEHHTQIVGRQCFYRAFSLVNGGKQRETDLFEGLRET